MSHWNGWFATTGPCELTAELWRRNDRGQWSGREEVGAACVEAFLPREGRCSSSAPAPAGPGLVTLRKFDPKIVRDPYDRRTRFIQANVELVAHENLDGRYQLEFRGECGKARAALPLRLGGATEVDPAMLQAGEVMKAEYRSYLGRTRAGRCEVEATLVPTDPAGTPISLGKTCFDDTGTKAC